MDLSKTTTRLRKAFHYPSDTSPTRHSNNDYDDDDDDDPSDMDEQEQEALIAKLRANDAARTQFYTQAYLVIPLLSAIPFLMTLFHSFGSNKQGPAGAGVAMVMTPILSISSLVCTAYMLYYLPLPPRKEGGERGAAPAPAVQTELSLRRLKGVLAGESRSGSRGPVQRLLLPLNAMLCVLLALRGWAEERRTGMEGQRVLGLLPGLILTITLLARLQLRPVDIASLEQLRYGYKGA